MIVNSSINNGFLRMKKEAMFFGLVSCSGIIKVTLISNGSPVLRSDMWVGMNLPQAIAFDTVLLESELDQKVQFWAANTPMTQSRATIAGANAAKTSTYNLRGGKSYPIVSSDLTRSSVRIKSNQNILIGGVGEQSWPISAGVAEDIPVAGMIYGFKEPAVINFDSSVITAETLDQWQSRESFWVSQDGNVRLQSDGVQIYRQDLSVNTTWLVVDAIDSIADKELLIGESGEVYAFHYRYVDDYYRIRKTVDGGVTWSTVVSRANVGFANNQSLVPTKSATHFTLKQGDNFWFIPVNGTEHTSITLAGSTVYEFSRHNNNVILGAIIGGVSGMYQSVDGGVTFDLVDTLPAQNFATTASGMVFLTVSKRLYESHLLTGDYKDVDDSLVSMKYEMRGMPEVAGTMFWVEGQRLVYLSFKDDAPAVKEIATIASFPNMQGTGYVYASANGNIYCEQISTATGSKGATVSYDIQGDVSPAKVLVLEFLS
jgi:hypothetical protein